MTTQEDKKVEVTLDILRDCLGEDNAEFIRVMEVVQHLIENPESFHGPKALITAVQLAALRTKISMKAQYYKTAKPKGEVNILQNRRRKDILLSMYSALEEDINTLKLMGRIDAASAGVIS